MPPESFIVWKQRGETPLETLGRVKMYHPEWTDLPMTYAGRLDPMAEGLLVVLIGEGCKKKDAYLGLGKTYEFEILVGFETDTYDVLGLATPSERSFSQVLGSPSQSYKDEKARPDRSKNFISDSVLQKFTGTFVQKYPIFSSKTVAGKQLFQYAKDDEIPDTHPEHEVTITKLEVTGERTISKEDLEKEIIERVSMVKGDFRQDEIIKRWQEVFLRSEMDEYRIISCIAECSSGTYIRQLVADIGTEIGIPLVTYSIKRTKVGQYAGTSE